MTKEEKILAHNQKLVVYFGTREYENAPMFYKEFLYLEKLGRSVRKKILSLSEENEAEKEHQLEQLFYLITGKDINNTRCFFGWQENEAFLQTEDIYTFDKGILVPYFEGD